MDFITLRRAALVGAASLTLLAGCATADMHSATPPARAESGVLVGSNGMTLYTFDKDPVGGGKSMCNGQCASNWPPLLAADSDRGGGHWSVITRDDGKKQWAYKGKPLYFWIKDQKPGDKTGEGVNNVWRAAQE
jgi:predicted lipoprotein with Yx(FWY)xxD motif